MSSESNIWLIMSTQYYSIYRLHDIAFSSFLDLFLILYIYFTVYLLHLDRERELRRRLLRDLAT